MNLPSWEELSDYKWKRNPISRRLSVESEDTGDEKNQIIIRLPKTTIANDKHYLIDVSKKSMHTSIYVYRLEQTDSCTFGNNTNWRGWTPVRIKFYSENKSHPHKILFFMNIPGPNILRE